MKSLRFILAIALLVSFVSTLAGSQISQVVPLFALHPKTFSSSGTRQTLLVIRNTHTRVLTDAASSPGSTSREPVRRRTAKDMRLFPESANSHIGPEVTREDWN
jgi:hypothetical protein